VGLIHLTATEIAMELNKDLQKAVDTIQQDYGADLITFRDHVTLIFPKGKIREVCQILRDKFSFTVLTDETAVDYWRRKEPRFEIVYQLHNREKNLRLFLRTPVSEDDPITQSIVSLFPNANWYEREIWDLFGIRFEDHPDLRRLLLPKGWEGHPLRKDVPLKVEEIRFSFNYERISRDKPRAEE
jgi:NADH-quinone oxidoreductase subunit C